MVAVSVKLTSKSPFFIGVITNRMDKKILFFKMPKFHNMKVDAPVVATHLLSDLKSVLTQVDDF